MLLPQAGWGRVGGGDTIGFMPHFESARARRLGRGGRGGRHRTDRSARRSGRDHRRDRTLPACCSARRCTARSLPMRCACRGSRFSRWRRCIARNGTTGPTRWTFASNFSGWPLRRCRSGCAPRRSPRCIPGRRLLDRCGSALRRLARGRFIEQAAQSLAAAAAAPPQLSAADGTGPMPYADVGAAGRAAARSA